VYVDHLDVDVDIVVRGRGTAMDREGLKAAEQETRIGQESRSGMEQTR